MVAHTAVTATPARSAPLRRRRRAFPVIDARFQWKYTMLGTLVALGIGIVLAALVYGAHRDASRLLALAGNEQLQQEVARGDQLMLGALVAALLLLGIVLILWWIVLTHRISGPLHLASRYLGLLAQGYFPSVRSLRRRDELKDFFASFEGALQNLRSRHYDELRQLETTIAVVRQCIDRGETERGVEEALRMLEQRRASVAQSLGTHGTVS